MRVFFLTAVFMSLLVPWAYAQDAGFFIPQKVIKQMRQPEKLPPIRVQPLSVTNRVAPVQATTSSNANRVEVKSQPQPQPQLNATKAVSAPQAVAVSRQNAAPTQADTAGNTRREAAAQPVKPVPVQEPMVPQTGTPAVPVTADTVAEDETAQAVAAALAKVAEEEKPELTFDDIIAEYKHDIEKISKNQPVENNRLDEMLKKYHDEEIIYN